MKNILFKDTIKQISKTRKRFISILLMAFLGVGFFAGVRSASPDMRLTIDKYFDDNKVHDLSVVSTLGLTDEDVTEISKVEGVESAYGIYSEDVFMTLQDEDIVVKVYGLNENIDRPEIVEGRFPENDNECVIDVNMTELRNVQIGQEIEIEENLDTTDEEKTFKNNKLKVVGLVRSPLYVSRDRGTTKLGTGKIAHFIYVNSSNIDSDYYTEVAIKVKGAEELKTISDDYKDLVASISTNVEGIKEEREKVRSDKLRKEANDKLNDAQKEFDEKKADGEKEIADAEKDIKDAKIKIQDGERDLADGRKEADEKFAEAEQKIKDNDWTLAQASQAITDNVIYLEGQKKEAQKGIEQIDNGIKQIDAQLNPLIAKKAELESGLVQINQLKSKIADNNKMIAALQAQLQTETDPEKIKEINVTINNLNAINGSLNIALQEAERLGVTQENLNKLVAGINEAQAKKQELINTKKSIQKGISDGEAQIVIAQNQIADGRNKLNEARNELAKQRKDVDKELKDAQNEIDKGKRELADGEKELADAKKEFDEKIRDAEEKLIDAREKVNDIDTAKWYIFDRNDNQGFNGYEQDAGNVEKLGLAFPIVFFIIATLTSLTTMTRMVEEERVEIGTLKALGYSKMQIMSKYITYSLLASLLGGALGAAFGSQFFPRIIISMYQLMYNIDNLVIEFNWYFVNLGIIIMTLCIVGSTIYTASKELVATPAQMMRPKAPKAGKRVLIERIPFIWNRFNFTQKVTLRNMFRYKKRFLMTVVGICGCTALILAGFGLKDSVSRIMTYQYEDIYNYDMMIVLKDTLTIDETNKVIADLEAKEDVKKVVPINLISETAKLDDKQFEAQVLVTDNSDVLNEVIRLKDKKTEERIFLNDNEVIITDKLAQLLDVKPGQEIIVSDPEEGDKKVKVGGITEHFIGHYIYMTTNLYNNLYEEDDKTNVLLANYKDDLNKDQEYALSEEILIDPKIGSIMLTSNLMETMNDTLSAMNVVVYILIISAGILAFVVLYNLANINISERIRELATIKVLGFYDKEVFEYVTREIVLLTIIGIVFGLVFGFVLNSFILGTCEIEMLRFKRIILPQSYLFSVAITIVFTYIVNFVTYFSLKKINMIESLKSIE